MMFGELPKLFDRDFAIAYFLPSAGFVAGTYWLIAKLIADFKLNMPLLNLSQQSVLRDLTVFGLVALFGAIILSALNRGVVRLMEGYWPFDLGQYLNWLEKKRFRALLKKEAQSDAEKKRCGAAGLSRELQNERNRILRKKAERFPDLERLVLPTSFGNAIRAFEIYPRAVYGIDAIPGWYRLMAVVPEDYRGLMDSARARVDLWVNLSFLSAIVAFEFLSIAMWARWSQNSWPSGSLFLFPFCALVLAYTAYRFATSAAIEWGHWVKSAFDLYLPELRQKLEFTIPDSNVKEREMWNGFNKVAIYRNVKSMPTKTRNFPVRNSRKDGDDD